MWCGMGSDTSGNKMLDGWLHGGLRGKVVLTDISVLFFCRPGQAVAQNGGMAQEKKRSEEDRSSLQFTARKSWGRRRRSKLLESTQLDVAVEASHGLSRAGEPYPPSRQKANLSTSLQKGTTAPGPRLRGAEPQEHWDGNSGAIRYLRASAMGLVFPD